MLRFQDLWNCRYFYTNPLYYCTNETQFLLVYSGSPLYSENRGNDQEIPCQRNHGEFGNLAKTLGSQGILFVQVVNSQILKMENIVISAEKFPKCFFETECVCQVSFADEIVPYFLNWHREHFQSNREKREKTENLSGDPGYSPL